MKKNPSEELLDLVELLEKIDTKCLVCENQVIAYWDPKYNGVRAACEKCNYNWAES